jgi:hypothetical protein
MGPTLGSGAEAYVDYGWRAQFGFLDTFWRDVIAPRPGREWLVGALFDGDLRVRDARALELVHERLHGRRDVRYRFVRAWLADPTAAGAYSDVFFIGRPRAYNSSGLAAFSSLLERDAVAQFRDTSTGRTGNSIRYRGLTFSRHELVVPPEDGYRRCDRDYGVLLYRGGIEGDPERRLVAIAGLSMLGTLGLTLVLTDDARRAELLGQVRRLAPWTPGLRPSESFEVCVRISVAGEEQLATFLNCPEFRFQVEAVAVAGGEPAVRDARAAEIELVPRADGSGILRIEGLGEADLSPARFELIRFLHEQPDRATADVLRQELKFGKHGGKRSDQALTKLVHDTNRQVRRQIRGLGGAHVIRHRKKTGRYYLAGTESVD